jgi:hypothetical protein
MALAAIALFVSAGIVFWCAISVWISTNRFRERMKKLK